MSNLVQLLGRQQCHLCTQVAQQLTQSGIHFHLIDIDCDPQLQALYGSVIPVLVCRKYDAELVYPFTDKELLDWIQMIECKQ